MTTNLSEKKRKLLEEVMSNEDLLLLVFFCLPVKSLIRFKSVSKRWLSLISDPKFCSKYTRLNPKSPILGIYFAYKWTTELRCVSLTQPNQKDIPTLAFMNDGWRGFKSEVPAIRHACNGWFLCYYSYKKPYYVYNATTQTSVVLPQHPFPACNYDYYDQIDTAFLVFDPSKSTHFKVVLFNMGYRNEKTVLHSNDVYKDEMGADLDRCYEIDVYSSETQVWERMYFLAPHGNSHIDYIAACDGTLHWITTEKFHGRFEVDTTKLSFIEMPPKTKTMDVQKIRYFGECCGHLYLVYVPFRSTKVFNVFELDKDHNSWTVKYHVDMCPLISSFPDSFRCLERNGVPKKTWNFVVLCVVKENEGSDLALLIAMPGKIVSYNLNSKMFKVVDELPMEEFPLRERYYAFARTFPFMPNLSLV